MQLIIDLRLKLVRELLNDKALNGDAEQRLTTLLVHRYEEEVPTLEQRPFNVMVREALHTYCVVAMRHYKNAFTFDQLHAFIMTADYSQPEIRNLFDGPTMLARRIIVSGRYLLAVQGRFAEYVITEKPTISGPGVTQHLLPIDGTEDSYFVRCRESTESK